MSHALAERPIAPEADWDWVTLDEGWEPGEDASIYASIRALRATPMHLSGDQAAMFAGAKQTRARRAAKPLSIG